MRSGLIFKRNMAYDVVYTLGIGSQWGNNEIKYSLRSISRNLKNFRNVWIVGECPNFLTNVYHLPYPDKFTIPDQNIADKIRHACECPYISDDFLFINDDHYLLKPFDIETFPYFWDTTLDEKVKRLGHVGYGARVGNTLRHLQANGLPIKNFDVHTPILYNKKLFLDNVMSVDWSNAYIIKSLYANSLKIEGVQIEDNKTERIPTGAIFSSRPKVGHKQGKWFREFFPKKSIFER